VQRHIRQQAQQADDTTAAAAAAGGSSAAAAVQTAAVQLQTYKARVRMLCTGLRYPDGVSPELIAGDRSADEVRGCARCSACVKPVFPSSLGLAGCVGDGRDRAQCLERALSGGLGAAYALRLVLPAHPRLTHSAAALPPCRLLCWTRWPWPQQQYRRRCRSAGRRRCVGRLLLGRSDEPRVGLICRVGRITVASLKDSN
jgi:hypothetical protein